MLTARCWSCGSPTAARTAKPSRIGVGPRLLTIEVELRPVPPRCRVLPKTTLSWSPAEDSALVLHRGNQPPHRGLHAHRVTKMIFPAIKRDRRHVFGVHDERVPIAHDGEIALWRGLIDFQEQRSVVQPRTNASTSRTGRWIAFDGGDA